MDTPNSVSISMPNVSNSTKADCLNPPAGGYFFIDLSCDMPDASGGTNYEYEIALNEEKRSIDLLRNEYLGFFTDEFENSI